MRTGYALFPASVGAGAVALVLVSCEGTTPPIVPTQLGVSTQPSSTAPSGLAIPQQPTVQLLDANGGIAGRSDVAVTAAIASGGGTLGGTATVQTNASGQAIFTDLIITGLVGPRTLAFSSPSLTGVTADPIDLTPGPASQLALTTAPSSTAQSGIALAQQPVVQLRDASGNAVAQGSVPVTPALSVGGGTLNPPDPISTDAAGQAGFANLTIRGLAGARTLQFSAPGLAPVSSPSINLTAGAALQLAITIQPPDTARGGVVMARQPRVQLRDAEGNNVGQDGIAISAGLATGTGSLSGTTSIQTDASGQAVYTDLAISGGGGHTIRFTADGLNPDSSTTIALPTPLVNGAGVGPFSDPLGSTRWFALDVPGSVAQLVVSTEGTAGDADIYVRSGALPSLSAYNCQGISPTTTEQCTIPNPAAGPWYVLLHAYSAYSTVTLTATYQLGAQVAIATQPADTARSGVALARQPVVQLQDAGGNNVNQPGVPITATVAIGSGFASLSGTTTVPTDATGVATYTNLAVSGSGTHTLQFSASGPTTTSSAITLPTPLAGDEPVTGLSGTAGSNSWLVVLVPAATSQLTVTTGDGTGDVDVYVRYDALPSLTASDCASTTAGTVEQCGFANPAAGPWYILLRGAGVYDGVTLTVTPPIPCSLNSPADADSDRLPDCVETNTRVFVNSLDTGTDPNDPDTDDDGLPDGDEVRGTALGLDLPLMGASPLRRDILIEYDWFDDALDCAPHSHRPTAAALAAVTVAFAGAPGLNPDGSTGINVIHDYGQGGAFTGGNLIPDADGVLDDGVNGFEFQTHKQANADPKRAGYFHYTLLPHRYNTNSASSGQAELPGDDMIVSLYCAGSDQNVANTIMHELGHNLLLRHGGFETPTTSPTTTR